MQYLSCATLELWWPPVYGFVTGERGSPHFGGSDLTDFLTYLAFAAVIAGCLWFLDSNLKNESD